MMPCKQKEEEKEERKKELKRSLPKRKGKSVSTLYLSEVCSLTLMVSRGCPTRTRQAPPKPPAKKSFLWQESTRKRLEMNCNQLEALIAIIVKKKKRKRKSRGWNLEELSGF